MSRHVRARRIATTPRFTRARAILAGGLVLGVGAAVTYASWTDSEYATGSFSASSFNTESTVDGTIWADNAGAPGAALTLAATELSPSVVKAAPFGIRAKAGSVAGNLVLQTPTTTGALGSALEYRVYTMSDANHVAGCTTDLAPIAAAGWIVGSAGSWSTVPTPPPSNSTTVVAGSASAAGTPTWFCFQVRIPAGADNALQGASGNASWQFTAASTP
jgi:predicted ribosomally synthesized peptide with SipW-like signal peptide